MDAPGESVRSPGHSGGNKNWDMQCEVAEQCSGLHFIFHAMSEKEEEEESHTIIEETGA